MPWCMPTTTGEPSRPPRPKSPYRSPAKASQCYVILLGLLRNHVPRIHDRQLGALSATSSLLPDRASEGRGVVLRASAAQGDRRAHRGVTAPVGGDARVAQRGVCELAPRGVRPVRVAAPGHGQPPSPAWWCRVPRVRCAARAGRQLIGPGSHVTAIAATVACDSRRSTGLDQSESCTTAALDNGGVRLGADHPRPQVTAQPRLDYCAGPRGGPRVSNGPVPRTPRFGLHPPFWRGHAPKR
jgi:hypothetical protein